MKSKVWPCSEIIVQKCNCSENFLSNISEHQNDFFKKIYHSQSSSENFDICTEIFFLCNISDHKNFLCSISDHKNFLCNISDCINFLIYSKYLWWKLFFRPIDQKIIFWAIVKVNIEMPHTMYGAAENNRDSPYYFIINIEMPKRDASSPPNNTVIYWLNPPPLLSYRAIIEQPLIYILYLSILSWLYSPNFFCSKLKVWTII